MHQMVTDAFKKKPNTAIQGDKKITVDGCPGREVTFTLRGMNCISRSILVQNRIYTMNTVSGPGHTFPDEVNRFFGSFKVLKK